MIALHTCIGRTRLAHAVVHPDGMPCICEIVASLHDLDETLQQPFRPVDVTGGLVRRLSNADPDLLQQKDTFQIFCAYS